MEIHRIETPTRKSNGSFEDEDPDIDQTDGQCQEELNQDNLMKAYALYEFNGKEEKSRNWIYFRLWKNIPLKDTRV